MLAHAVVHGPHRLAFPHDLSRYTLPDFALRSTILNQRLRRPRKHVDEARRNGEPLRIDYRLRFGRFEIADASDSITSNRDIRLLRLGTGAVVNSPVADDHVKISLVRRWSRLLVCEHSEGNRQECTEPQEVSFHWEATVANRAF